MRSLGIAAILVLLVSSQVLCRPQNQYLDNEEYDTENQQDQADNEDTQADAEGDDVGYNDDKEEKKKSGPPPQIVTKSQHFYARPGDTITLPCEIINEDGSVIQWQKGLEPIFFDGDLMANDENKYKLIGNSLSIKNLNRADSSDQWTCQILDNGKQPTVRHTLTVQDNIPLHITTQSPPQNSQSSLTVLPDKPIQINEGQSTSFGCETSEVPKVEIKWYFKGTEIHKVPGIRREGNYVFIDKATRHHAGEYNCLAEDRSSTPKTGSVHVIVNYAPVIEVPHKVVHTGLGRVSEISCKVDAHPHAHVKWHKNSIDGPVYNGEKSHKVENNTGLIIHTLKIQSTTQNDLGTYVCHAANNMSAVNMEVILTAEPTKPILNHGEDKDNSHMVRWRVESYSPIEQTKLEYRGKNDDKWTVVTPEIKDGKEDQFFIEHYFLNLEPGVYQVKLQAKNHYGWSPISAVHEFRKELVADEPQNVKGHSSTIQPQAALTALLLLVVSSRVFTCL